MHNLNKNIEESARIIFRLFFGSNLFLKKNPGNIKTDCRGVNLLMNYNGRKKLSLYLEDDTVRSVVKKLTGHDDISSESIAYDIMGEMATLIAGSALGETCENIDISHPIKSDIKNPLDSDALMFSSELGKFAIAIEDV